MRQVSLEDVALNT